jgi:hypothetical protein
MNDETEITRNTTDIAVLGTEFKALKEINSERFALLVTTMEKGFGELKAALKDHAADDARMESSLRDAIKEQGKDVGRLNKFMWGALGALGLIEAYHSIFPRKP